MATVFVPSLVRTLTGGVDQVQATGKNVRQLVDDLERKYPGIRDRLCTGGELRPGLAVAVDGTIARKGLAEPVNAKSEVHFLPAIGGG